MPKLKVKDGELFYQIRGEGTPLILHQGLGRSSAYWLGFENELSKNFQVVTFDTRGLGQSQNSGMPLSLTLYDLADDVRELMSHIKIDKSHILGTSMGGMVSLAMASRYPEAVSSLVIMNSSIGGRFLPRISPLGLASLVTSGTLPKAAPYILSLSLLGRKLSFDRRKELINIWKDLQARDWPSKDVALKHLMAAVRFGFGEDFKKILTPALVLFGEHDHLVPAINSKKIHQLLPEAEIREIKGGGHEMFLEHGDEIVHVIEEFIGRMETGNQAPSQP